VEFSSSRWTGRFEMSDARNFLAILSQDKLAPYKSRHLHQINPSRLTWVFVLRKFKDKKTASQFSKAVLLLFCNVMSVTNNPLFHFDI
jgi:hypothetical protein